MIQQICDYCKEIVDLCKKSWIVMISFVIISAILEIFSVPFISIFLLIFLMFYLSRTEEYKKGNWKIFQFFLFFVFLVLFVILFLIPGVIFLSATYMLSAENIVSSPFAKIGAYTSLIFVFAPYRIFDANANIFKALKYSYRTISNNFLVFFAAIIFLITLNYFTTNINHIDYLIYFIDVICTVSIYKLNVKKSLYKDAL